MGDKVLGRLECIQLEGDEEKPYLACEFELLGDLESFSLSKGDTMYKRLYLTEGAFKWSLETLRTMGFNGDDLSKVEEIVGFEGQLVMAVSEYNGKERTEIKFINKVGGKPMEGEMKLTFAQRFREKIAALEGEKDDGEELGF